MTLKFYLRFKHFVLRLPLSHYSFFSDDLFKATIFYNLKKATFHHPPNLTKSPDLQAYSKINSLV